VVAAKLAFLVIGGTGSGKTTLLAALLGCVPHDQRVVCVEDAGELQPQHPQVVRLLARSANVEGAGEVPVRELVRQALRMRPDRIVVGEVRGAEVCDLLAALNTGHDGGAGTLHANSPAEVPARLEALAALGGLNREALHSQLAAAVQVVLHMRRAPNGTRHLAEIGVFERQATTLLVRTAWHHEDGEQQAWPALRTLLAARGHPTPVRTDHNPAVAPFPLHRHQARQVMNQTRRAQRTTKPQPCQRFLPAHQTCLLMSQTHPARQVTKTQPCQHRRPAHGASPS
jgi:pilus assembly protein CpaF